MPDRGDIADYLLTAEDAIKPGDDVRVRPWQPPAPSWGQGTNPGPVFNGARFAWGQPLEVVEGLYHPKSGTVSAELVQQYPHCFMTEAQYQAWKSKQ